MNLIYPKLNRRSQKQEYILYDSVCTKPKSCKLCYRFRDLVVTLEGREMKVVEVLIAGGRYK